MPLVPALTGEPVIRLLAGGDVARVAVGVVTQLGDPVAGAVQDQ